MHGVIKGLATNMHGIIRGLASNMHNIIRGLASHKHEIIRGFGFFYIHKPQVKFMHIFHKSKWFQVFMPTSHK